MAVANSKFFVSLFFLSMLGCKSSATSSNQGSLTSTQLSSTSTKGAQNPYGGEQTNPNRKKKPAPIVNYLIPSATTTYIGPGSVVDIVFYPSQSSATLTTACTLGVPPGATYPPQLPTGLTLNPTTCEITGTVSANATITNSLNFIAQSTSLSPLSGSTPIESSNSFTLTPLSLAPITQDPYTVIPSALNYNMFAGFPTLITFMLPFAPLTPGQQFSCQVVSDIPSLTSLNDPANPPNPNSAYFFYTQSFTMQEDFLPGQPICTVSGSGLFPQSGIRNPANLIAIITTTPPGASEDQTFSTAITAYITQINNNSAGNLLVTQSISSTNINAAIYPASLSSYGIPTSSSAYTNQLPINGCYFLNTIPATAFGPFLPGYNFSQTSPQTCSITSSAPGSNYGPQTQNVQILIT
jgi:hypothetical protein